MATSLEDLAPQGGPEHSRVEVAAAVLLGLAAVAIAFSSYQSALWGGVQDTALTNSVLESNEAVDLFQLGDTTLSSDQALWTGMLTSGACGELVDLLALNLDAAAFDEFTPCGQILLGLSEGGLEAIRDWQSNEDLYPFDVEEYDAFLYRDAEDLEVTSRESFGDAQAANKNGDQYELASTFLTIALFFAGISFVLASNRIRWTLIAGSAAALIGSAAFLLSLPKTF